MSLASLGRTRTAVAALSLLLVDLLLRLVLGGPYRGATALLLTACATVLLPLLPAALARPSLRLAAAPALAVGSFTILVTTVSTLGIPLTEISIRAAVAVFVVSLAVAGAALGRPESLARAAGNARRPRWRRSWRWRRSPSRRPGTSSARSRRAAPTGATTSSTRTRSSGSSRC